MLAELESGALGGYIPSCYYTDRDITEDWGAIRAKVLRSLQKDYSIARQTCLTKMSAIRNISP